MSEERKGAPTPVPAGFQDAVRRYRGGDDEGALRACGELLAAQPAGEERAGILNLQAVILAGRGCLISAADRLCGAIDAHPESPQLHDHAARIDAALARWDKAERHARTACGLAPDSVPLRYRLARILRLSGRIAEAAHEIDACLAGHPDFAEGLILRSELFVDQGERPLAVDCLRRIVTHDPAHARAWAMLAGLAENSATGASVEDELRRLAQSAASPEDAATARFALAGSALRAGRDAEAFREFRAANDIRAAQSAFDIEAWERHVERLLDSEWVSPRAPSEDRAGERLAFLVGMPRSGTTLCEQVLSAHPAVFGAGELPAMEAVRAELALDGRGAGAGEIVPQQRLDALSDAYLKSLPAASANHLRVVDKAPRNFERLGLVRSLFPAARVIWMLRHPLDTVLSCYLQDFGPGQAFSNRLDHAARVYAGHARLLRQAADRIGSSLLIVRYADLVGQLEKTARIMADFIGLDFEPAMLRPDLNPRPVRTASAEQVRQPVHTDALGRWRRFATELGEVRAYFEDQGLLAADGSSQI